MRLLRFLVLVALAGLLCACQTMTPEERRIGNETTCASYGFRRGTEAIERCIQEIDRGAPKDASRLRSMFLRL